MADELDARSRRFGAASGEEAVLGLQHILRKLREPITHCSGARIFGQKRIGKYALRNMNSQLSVGFELFFIVELVQRRLMWEIRIHMPVPLEKLCLIAGQ